MAKLQFGRQLVDLERPQPEQIDWPLVRQRLRAIRRFSGDPAALTVWQHTRLAAILFAEDVEKTRDMAPRFRAAVRDWCHNHDNHEALTGDIPGPIKEMVTRVSNGHSPLGLIEWNLDRAIHGAAVAAGEAYIWPDEIDVHGEHVRRVTHHYDKLAETFEWRFVLRRPPGAWCARLPQHMVDSAGVILRDVYEGEP